MPPCPSTKGTVLRLVNLESFPLRLLIGDEQRGRILTIPPSGQTPRLEEKRAPSEPVMIGHRELPVVEAKTVIRDRLPDPEPGVLFVVPREVAVAAHGRDDVVYAAGYVRTKKRVVAATELRRPAR